MQRPADIPSTPGVFAVLHRVSAQAYVNKARNLKERAIIWAHHLKAHEADPTHGVRVRDWPAFPADQWEFWFTVIDPVEAVQAQFKGNGFKLINERVRKRTTYNVQGVEDTLLGHARRLGVPSGAVYKRVERGATPEQALGVSDNPNLDPREQAIEGMKMKILTDDGEGYLTYDEAVVMRPQLGEVRRKIRKLARKHPEMKAVKLSEIPV